MLRSMISAALLCAVPTVAFAQERAPAPNMPAPAACFSKQEAEAAIALFDAATRAQGLQAAEPALVIARKVKTMECKPASPAPQTEVK